MPDGPTIASISPRLDREVEVVNTGTGTSALRYVFDSDRASRKGMSARLSYDRASRRDDRSTVPTSQQVHVAKR